MLVSDKRKIIAFILAIIAITIFFTGFAYIAAPIAFVSILLVSMSPNKSGGWFTASIFFNTAIMGVIIDYPFSHFPVSLVAMLLSVVSLKMRGWLFERQGVHTGLLLDLAIGIVAIGLYIVGGIMVKYTLFNWIMSGLTMLQFIAFIFIVYGDRFVSRKLVAALKDQKNSIAPNFTLPDQNGNQVSLNEILKTNHALLIFVRGDWCPTCHVMLRGYVRNKEKFAERNVRIIGIGPDPQGINKEIMSRIDSESILLADNDQKVAESYVLNLQENNPVTKPLYKNGIPLPASFLIHKNGKIAFTSRSDKAGEILQPEKIFEVLETF